MLPWSFPEKAEAGKYMPQLQHNMWVVSAVLSVITGGKWDHHPYRSALPAPHRQRRPQILLLCRKLIARTQPAHLEHDKAKAELKTLLPDGAQQAIGHGVRASAAAKCRPGCRTVALSSPALRISLPPLIASSDPIGRFHPTKTRFFEISAQYLCDRADFITEQFCAFG